MRNESKRNAIVRRQDRGQGMTEYILIVVLVAIMTIGVTTVFGGNIRGLMGAATQALSGQQSVQNPDKPASSSQMGPGSLRTLVGQ